MVALSCAVFARCHHIPAAAHPAQGCPMARSDLETSSGRWQVGSGKHSSLQTRDEMAELQQLCSLQLAACSLQLTAHSLLRAACCVLAAAAVSPEDTTIGWSSKLSVPWLVRPFQSVVFWGVTAACLALLGGGICQLGRRWW